MANDDFDNARTDREMLDKPVGTVDLKTWPNQALVILNRAAAQELIESLQKSLAITIEPTKLSLLLRRTHGGTQVEISADDGGGATN